MFLILYAMTFISPNERYNKSRKINIFWNIFKNLREVTIFIALIWLIWRQKHILLRLYISWYIFVYPDYKICNHVSYCWDGFSGCKTTKTTSNVMLCFSETRRFFLVCLMFTAKRSIHKANKRRLERTTLQQTPLQTERSAWDGDGCSYSISDTFSGG